MTLSVNVKKSFEDVHLNIEFSTESRRIGIFGASGCGKSLALKMIAGIERPDAGSIVINETVMYDSGKRISLPPQKRNVGYLFQNYALFPTMNVEENVGAGLKCERGERKRKVSEMMKRFHLEGLEKRLPGELSGGQQQRVALARIMVYEPDVILLDEPFSALDAYLKDKMQRECMEMLRDYPGIVILVSHSRDEIYRFCEETIVVDKGRVIRQAETKALFQNPEDCVTARLTGCKNIAAVEQDEKGGLVVPDWGIKLPEMWKICLAGSRIVEKTTAYVGIRAHEFRTEPKVGDLEFPVLHAQVTEDMFEYNVSFKVSEAAEMMIDWKVPKAVWSLEKDGLPEKLYIAKEQMLFLTKE